MYYSIAKINGSVHILSLTIQAIFFFLSLSNYQPYYSVRPDRQAGHPFHALTS